MVAVPRPLAAPSLERQLAEQSAELDRVLGEVAQGVRSASHFEDLETRVTDICAGLRGAFRSARR